MPTSRHPIRRFLLGSLTCLTLALWLSSMEAGRADEKPAAKGATFRSLVDQNRREMLNQAIRYIASHPEADDVEDAYLWSFETAMAAGLEADAVPLAEQYLARRDLDQSSRQLAQTALCVGLARKGQLQEAVSQFDAWLVGARFQSPFRTLDLAGALAAQARISGNMAASREIFERVAASYPLNQQITGIVEGRIARQELIGKTAPSIASADTTGKAFDSSELAGKTFLVDFWATNCAPCLAEFPNLRQIYRDFHDKGFEIVGVSFDDSPDTVEAFRTRAKLPWRMIMNETPQGTISDRFRTQTIPALFLVDKKGTIAQVDVRGGDLRAVIEKLVAAKSP